MWTLYVAMSLLAAGVCFKLLHPLLGGGAAAAPADRRLAYGLMGLVPLVSISLYLFMGHPDLPGAPAIFTDLDTLMDRQTALLEEHPFQVLLEENPDNLGAIVQLAYLNNEMQKYQEAAKFFKRAVVLAAKFHDPLLQVYLKDLGVAEVNASSGTVTEDALATFKLLEGVQAGNAIGRYYIGLYKSQHGDVQGAIADWESILSEGPAAQPWKRMVRDSLAKANAGLKARETK